MATRTSFVEKLVEAYQIKRSDLHYEIVKATDEANRQRIKDYTSTPKWLQFIDLAGELIGPEKAKMISVSDLVRYRESGELSKMIGLEEAPGRYTNPKLDALILGALTTTSIKFWDGLYRPVNDYLYAIEAATTNEEIDAAILALVRAL